MAQQIIIQSEFPLPIDSAGGQWRLLLLPGPSGDVTCTPGLFCIWGAEQREFISFNLTKGEVIDYFLEQSKNEIVRKVNAACHELQTGEKPYGHFTKTFEEVVLVGKQTHGADHYEFKVVKKKK